MKEEFSVNNQKQQFQTGFLTDAGGTTTNKEYFAGVELANFACWVIAERLDSCAEKESARLAAEQVIQNFTARPTMSRAKIKKYLTNAHQKLVAESEKIKLRVGLLLVVTDYTRIIWAVAGNIRLYHLRQGKVNFRSKDQTMAQVMLDAGNLEESEMCLRNERNSLINFLGIPAEFKPLISRTYQLCDGDQLLLCNIKLWENLNNGDIESVWAEAPKAAMDCVNRLKTALLAKKPQVSNYIITTIAFERVRHPWMGKMGPYLRAIVIGIPASVLLLTGAVLLQWGKTPQMVSPDNSKAAIVRNVNNAKLQQQREATSILTEETVQTDSLLETSTGPVQPTSSPVLSVSGHIGSEVGTRLVNADSAATPHHNIASSANAPVLKSKAAKKLMKTPAPRWTGKEAVAKKAPETAAPERFKKRVTATKKIAVAGQSEKEVTVRKKITASEQFEKPTAVAKKPKETILASPKREMAKAEKLKKPALAGQSETEMAMAKLPKENMPAKPDEQIIIVDRNTQTVSQTVISTESGQSEKTVSKTAGQEKTAFLTERQTKEKQARLYEATGDERYQHEQYSEALEYYKLAYAAYRELGMKEAAVMVDRKINTTIKEKLVFLLKQALK
jgi:serine/threonine protein phosphatase PrpC